MAKWHPIMQAVEPEPGVWIMRDTLGRDYGTIELRRTNAGPRYKTTHDGRVLGWATSLRVATEQTHQAHLRSLGPGGGVNAGR